MAWRSLEAEIRLKELAAETRLKEVEVEGRLKENEVEAQLKLDLRRLELERPGQGAAPVGELYDIGRHVALPPFRESEVDAYFSTFERLATTLKWPKEVWSTLLQCKLTGKAQDVVASLPLIDSQNYEKVKAAVLCAYKLVPEAYRQQFRDYRKSLNQTYVEFAREKGTLFDKWCASTRSGS